MSENKTELPSMSIAICTYNRKDKLKECLQSISKLDYPRANFEVIVVDGGSVDGTKDLVEAHAGNMYSICLNLNSSFIYTLNSLLTGIRVTWLKWESKTILCVVGGEKVRALLVSPFTVMPLNEHTDLSPREPLGLEYLAAAAGSHDVQILDCMGSYAFRFNTLRDGMVHIGASSRQIKNKIAESKPDLVGVTSLFDTQVDSVNSIFDLVKSIDKDIITVIGGCAASCYPVETLEENRSIDIAVFGEGECTFRELLDKECTNLESVGGIVYRDNEKIIQNNPRGLIEDLDSLPFPRRALVPFENYSRPWHMSSQVMFFLKTRGPKYVLGRATSKAFGLLRSKIFGQATSNEKMKGTNDTCGNLAKY